MTRCEQTKLLKVCEGIASLSQLQLGSTFLHPRVEHPLVLVLCVVTASLLASMVTLQWLSIYLERDKPQRKSFLNCLRLPHD